MFNLQDILVKMKKQREINREIIFRRGFVLISFIFSLLLVSFVSAQDVNYCCEKTVSGAWCQNAPEGECDLSIDRNTNSSYRKTPTSCDATSFCKLGCCYDSREGLCMENSPQKVCDMQNGTWADSSECDVPQCRLGCCVLGDQAALVTLARCKNLAGFYGLESDFRTNIQNELTCIGIAQSKDKGACVYELDFQRTCKFTNREDCLALGTGSNSNGTITNSTTSFYKDFLCSAEELATNCGQTSQTMCVEGKDEVYFKDSCGNPANIYDASKLNDPSYWKKVVDKAETCGDGKGNLNSPSCGNCDYYLGSYCRAAERITDRPTYGDNICRDLNCYDTSDGEDHKHGESWCSYEGVTGEGLDSVGSRHFRHICVNGEELVEACADFRNEICIEDNIPASLGGEFSQAACRPNRWKDCILQTTQENCENQDKRDCFWVLGYSFTGIVGVEGESKTTTPTQQPFQGGSAGVTGQSIFGFGEDDSSDSSSAPVKEGIIKSEGGLCTPNWPAGINFWESGEATSICSQGNAECEVTYEKGLIGERKCIDNCECLEQEWGDDMNKICIGLSDCGGYINYLGKFTDDGYSWISEGEEKSISQAIAEQAKPA